MQDSGSNGRSSAPVRIISLRDNFHFVREWYELSSADHFWIQWRFQVLKKMLTRLALPVNESLRGVDIGCGNSVLRQQIESATQWSMDGFELDQYALSMGTQTRGQLYLYDIRDRNPDFEEKFDVISMFDILEHYSDPDSFLRDTLFHLKKGGYCIINVPAVELLRSRYDEVAGHELRYSVKILRRHAERVGFRVLDVRYWGFSLIFPLWVRRYVVSAYEDGGEVIKKGFTPPGKLAHVLLKLMGKMETTLAPWVPLGTSVLMIAQKT